MTMRARLSRLFTIKTRFEAFMVIYAIALGAMERARHYIETYPGKPGYILAAACSGVVFIAGAKILDAVRRDRLDEEAALAASGAPAPSLARRLDLSRNRPRLSRSRRDAASPRSFRID
ncbi:hypothetical protein ABDK56_12855 [Sphingomonas sp. ASV193]|uniref:hypothetical protein n=1 Tax=Sphingomonas sp. ASV193 TaxID=3144405 RepID=UPI0032E84E15